MIINYILFSGEIITIIMITITIIIIIFLVIKSLLSDVS